MSDNDLPSAKEIKSSPEPKQRRKSSPEIFASFTIYLIAGMMVLLIMLFVFVYE